MYHLNFRRFEFVKMSESSQLGFYNLPFLAHRKSVKRGFEFTLMVVGEQEGVTITIIIIL